MTGTAPPRGYFIAGTDTGVGKTRIAAALCAAFAAAGFKVAAMKPVASGCERTPAGLRNEDALELLAAMNVRASYADVNPYAFEPAIAPHVAATDAGMVIEYAVLDRAFDRLRLQSDVLVVEGAGGWLTPLDQGRSFADLAARWHLQVILVVGLRLGCINHALLTAESIERRGLTLKAWVGNRLDPAFSRVEATIETLRERLAAPCLGIVPHTPGQEPAARHARPPLDISLL